MNTAKLVDTAKLGDTAKLVDAAKLVKPDEIVGRYTEVLRRLADDPVTLDGADRVALVGELQRLRTWLDAREADVLSVIHRARDDVNAGARDLTQLSQQEANVGYGEAKRRELRAVWTNALPPLHAALQSGALGTPQVDEFCLLAERLDPTDRDALRTSLDELIVDVADLTPVRTRKHLRAFESSLDADDGTRRLQKQRSANALRLPRQADGTTRVAGQLDPVSAEYVTNAIAAKVADMWRREGSGRADMAPPDRVLTNEQRRAAALVELIRAGAAADPATRGRADVIVIIDYQTLLGQLSLSPTVVFGSGEPVPATEARRLACGANIIPVVMGGPSRPLDVGRSARVATPAQRAALRVVHDTCCIGGCDVPFDYCEIHHITWWRHGGPSDIDNLAPLCHKHHHLCHDDSWILTLDPDRVGHLTRRMPTAVPVAAPPTTDGVEDQVQGPHRHLERRPPPETHRPVPEHLRPMRC